MNEYTEIMDKMVTKLLEPKHNMEIILEHINDATILIRKELEMSGDYFDRYVALESLVKDIGNLEIEIACIIESDEKEEK